MTADAREAGAQQVANQEKQPIFVGSAVGVSECDERSGGCFDAGISGGAQAEVLGVPKADDAGEEGGDGRGGIGRAVIHQIAIKIIPSSLVFIDRRHIFAMVNPRGMSQAHVLICPVRQVAKFTELTELETLELFVTAK